MKIVNININKAIKIAKGGCPYNMEELRGAIRTFFDALGFEDKKIFLPKGETAGSWLVKLYTAYNDKTTTNETLVEIIESKKVLKHEDN